MGQKVNPHGLRTGVMKDWESKWYPEETQENFLVNEPLKIEMVKDWILHKIEVKRKQYSMRIMQKVKRMILPRRKLVA